MPSIATLSRITTAGSPMKAISPESVLYVMGLSGKPEQNTGAVLIASIYCLHTVVHPFVEPCGGCGCMKQVIVPGFSLSVMADW